MLQLLNYMTVTEFSKRWNSQQNDETSVVKLAKNEQAKCMTLISTQTHYIVDHIHNELNTLTVQHSVSDKSARDVGFHIRKTFPCTNNSTSITVIRESNPAFSPRFRV
jgi:hypothetical protein